MDAGHKIGLEYLLPRREVSRFLSSYPGVSREIGLSESRENRFVRATDGDAPFEDFKSSMKNLRDEVSLDGGNYTNIRGRLSGERRVGSFAGARGGEHAGILRERSSVQDLIPLSLNEFFGANSELLEIFDSDPSLRETLSSGEPLTNEDVRGEIVDLALSRLDYGSSVTKAVLDDSPETALAIALNVGGIAERLNEDKDLARTFASSPQKQMEVMAQDNAARKAASLFDEGSVVTESFLQDNPLAAIYLLENQDVAARLNRLSPDAREFVATVAQLNERMESRVVDRAAELLSGNSVVTDEYLEQSPGFAAMIVADSLTAAGGTIADYINSNVATISDKSDLRAIFASRQASIAGELLDNSFPIGEDFLTSNPGMAALLNRSSEYLSDLKADLDDVERFIRVEDVPTLQVFPAVWNAISAFGAGYAQRDESALDIVA